MPRKSPLSVNPSGTVRKRSLTASIWRGQTELAFTLAGIAASSTAAKRSHADSSRERRPRLSGAVCVCVGVGVGAGAGAGAARGKIADKKEAKINAFTDIITKTIATLDVECDQDAVGEMRKRFRMAIREQSQEPAAGKMQIEEKGDEEETEVERKRKASAPRPETGLEAPMGNVRFESPRKP
ncbi:hypothetical protein EPUS_01156 [Endocarpon pusillum Z07020]|uniref:Uncharacterized protein n=1 Tax=Endocarpon pusillum (strain Z07020 / HMAS-L-300199) TaxID=1263415 RepID=U1HJU8_ENDPU|nr:uncharacterized protein EPUS_01156 [Endocarpon pusillum Z07020]ERF69199.1 hypothetical protein EPUS_01156 [Endocarpon pusillum Z07020]